MWWWFKTSTRTHRHTTTSCGAFLSPPARKKAQGLIKPQAHLALNGWPRNKRSAPLQTRSARRRGGSNMTPSSSLWVLTHAPSSSLGLESLELRYIKSCHMCARCNSGLPRAASLLQMGWPSGTAPGPGGRCKLRAGPDFAIQPGMIVCNVNLSCAHCPGEGGTAATTAYEEVAGSLPPPTLSPRGHLVVAVCLGFIGTFGFLSNFLVLALFCRYRALRTPMNLLLVSISVSDLLVSVLGTPFSFAASTQGRWLIGHAGCVWYGFVNACLGEQLFYYLWHTVTGGLITKKAPFGLFNKELFL